MHTRSTIKALALAAGVVLSTHAFAQPRPAAPAAPAGPVELVRSGDWAAYSVTDAQRNRSCYALATPRTADPAVGPRRDPTNMFITARPRQNVRNEISIVIGYVFQPNSAANIEVVASAGNQRFAMITRDRAAWVENPAQETQMIAAMRAGRELIVRGTSSRGTATTDRYSLTGLGAVLDRIAADCR